MSTPVHAVATPLNTCRASGTCRACRDEQVAPCCPTSVTRDVATFSYAKTHRLGSMSCCVAISGIVTVFLCHAITEEVLSASFPGSEVPSRRMGRQKAVSDGVNFLDRIIKTRFIARSTNNGRIAGNNVSFETTPDRVDGWCWNVIGSAFQARRGNHFSTEGSRSRIQ